VGSQPLNPTALLAQLVECGVDFVVVGALAVGTYGEVRGTGDVDVMVPINDDANRKALDKALRKLDARKIPASEGGIEQGEPEYPTLMFQTRFGKLDILYRPDGSAPYSKVKQRAVVRTLGGQSVAVVGKDDLLRMKLAAGRPHDLQDVASLTASEKGELRRIQLTMKLLDGVAEEWAHDLTAARVALFDERARVWVQEGYVKVDARRSGLTDEQLQLWAQSLAERLHGSEILAEPACEAEITGI